MKTLKFKTNIKCSGCTAAVTPYLNELTGEDNWTVDLQSAEKTLTVATDDASAEDVQKAVEAAGYKAELAN